MILTVMAIASVTASMLLAGGAVPTFMMAENDLDKALQAGLYAFTAFAATFACIALALQFFRGRSPIRRYLADASYWIYIVHLPIIMVGQVWVSGMPGPWWLKLGGLLTVSLLLMLVSYELIVRHTFIGRFLNGKRIPWRRADATPDQPATAMGASTS